MEHLNPSQKIKKEFGDKEKLVDSLVGKLNKRDGESKDDFKKRLLGVSSKKLLRLKKRVDAS